MKIVTRDELMAAGRGTIFCDWQPHHCGPLKRFDGVLGDDFVEIDIGPRCVMAETDPEHPYYHIAINDDSSRDGLFEGRQKYLILDDEDVAKIITQLQGVFSFAPSVLEVSAYF